MADVREAVLPPWPVFGFFRKPLFAADEVQDIAQEQHLDFLCPLFRCQRGEVGQKHLIEGSMGQVVLAGGPIRKMQITDRNKHMSLLSILQSSLIPQSL